jgi:hypothetical protein
MGLEVTRAADEALASPRRIGRAVAIGTSVLGLADFFAIALHVDWTTDAGPQVFRFAPRMLVALPLLTGALAFFAAKLFASRPPGRARSLGVDFVCALPLLACMPALFSGASIAASPWRWPLLLGTLAGAFAFVALLRRLCAFVLARLPAGDQARQAAGAAALLAMVAGVAAAAYVSARVLRGLYPSFHGALALIALGLAAASLVVVLAANHKPAIGMELPNFVITRRAIGALGGGVVLWVATIGLCARSGTGRNALIEHAPFTGTIVPAMFLLDAAGAARASRQVVPPASAGVPLPSARFPSPAAQTKPHVVLITVDALRGDVLDEGSRYAPCATQLRALAQRHVAFTRAYAPSNATIYALPGILTGLARAGADTPRTFYLPAVLAEQGYEAQAWVTQHDVTLVDNDLARLRKLGFHFSSYKNTYSSAEALSAWALERLTRDEPQLVWLHLSDVHAPYSLPAGPPVEGCAMADEYGPRLATLDQVIGRLIAELELRNDVVWAFTSDHGESRGERGVYGHASNLFEEQVRVPLILGGTGVGRRTVDTPITALDLPATLLEMIGARLPDAAPRLPWRAEAHEVPRRPAISFADNGCAVTRDRLKLLVDDRAGTLLLFDLANDPDQQQNVVNEHPNEAKALFGLLAPPFCSEQVTRLAWLLPH